MPLERWCHSDYLWRRLGHFDAGLPAVCTNNVAIIDCRTGKIDQRAALGVALNSRASLRSDTEKNIIASDRAASRAKKDESRSQLPAPWILRQIFP